MKWWDWRPWRRVDRDTGGRAARERAERDLAAVRRVTPQVTQLANELRAIRETNGFAAGIRQAMGVDQ